MRPQKRMQQMRELVHRMRQFVGNKKKIHSQSVLKCVCANVKEALTILHLSLHLGNYKTRCNYFWQEASLWSSLLMKSMALPQPERHRRGQIYKQAKFSNILFSTDTEGKTPESIVIIFMGQPTQIVKLMATWSGVQALGGAKKAIQ